GLAFLLLFIGVKLILHAMHENELPFVNGGQHIDWAPDIPILASLGAIIGILAVTTVASLVASARGVESSSPLADALEKTESSGAAAGERSGGSTSDDDVSSDDTAERQ
ncbi:MAG: TerC family protein, partial [Nocardioidaceae bacterium]